MPEILDINLAAVMRKCESNNLTELSYILSSLHVDTYRKYIIQVNGFPIRYDSQSVLSYIGYTKNPLM